MGIPLYSILFAGALFAAAGCSKKEPANLIENQRSAMKSALGTTPYTVRDSVYVVIANAGRAGYATAHVIAAGDQIRYDYAAYMFSSSQTTMPYFSNRRDWYPKGAAPTPVPGMEYEPMAVTVGSTPMLQGLARALPGCRLGDSVRLYITSDLAYGSQVVGTIPMNTPLLYILKIEETMP